jgi:putative FmdB family regulatory protein
MREVVDIMPIYEYQCTDCGEIEEALQKFSDKPLTTCASCSGKLQRLISQSSFHLKGSGWYATDYANKSNMKSATSNDTGSPKADSASTKKAVDKTDTTKKAKASS